MKYKELVLAGILLAGCDKPAPIRGIVADYHGEPARYAFEDLDRNGKYDLVHILEPEAAAKFLGSLVYRASDVKETIRDEKVVSNLYKKLENGAEDCSCK